MYERHCSIFLVRISTLIPTRTHGLETLLIGEVYRSVSNSSSRILLMKQPIPLPSPTCVSHTHTYKHMLQSPSLEKCANSKHIYTPSTPAAQWVTTAWFWVLFFTRLPCPGSPWQPHRPWANFCTPHIAFPGAVFCPESDAHHNVDTPFPESALPLRGQDPMHALSDGPEQWYEGLEGFPSSFSPTRVQPGPEPALGPVRTSLPMAHTPDDTALMLWLLVHGYFKRVSLEKPIRCDGNVSNYVLKIHPPFLCNLPRLAQSRTRAMWDCNSPSNDYFCF